MSEEATATPEVTTEVTEALPSDWVNGLPDKLRTAPFLRKTKDGKVRTVDEVLSALENAAKLQGNLAESHIKIPSHDAADTDKAAAQTRILSLWPNLRVVTEDEDTLPPTEVAGYKLPEGADALDPALLEDMGKFGIDHNWGQNQFSDYATKMVEAQTSSNDQAIQWQADQNSKLNEKLGGAKEEHLGRTCAALESAGASAEYISAMKEGQVDADLVMVLDNLVGKMIDMGDEGSQFVQQVNTGARSLTPSEHRDRATELFITLQSTPKTSPKFHELNNKRMEHIGLGMER